MVNIRGYELLGKDLDDISSELAISFIPPPPHPPFLPKFTP